MDESLLPPPVKGARPVPWRAIAAAFVPAAALAAGTGLQRWLEGSAPSGDVLLRWLLWSAGAGLFVGAGVGLLRGSRLPWAVYGAAAPLLAVGLVLGALRAVLPVREWIADRAEAACRAEGRPVCSVREFDAACARRDRRLLGEPQQTLCRDDKDGACTLRWLYRGPFRPEQRAPRGAFLCSVVTDALGNGIRSSLMAVADP